MNIVIFLIGFVIFILFTTGQVKERRTEEIENWRKNYYDRYNLERKKNPKYKKGSQSRLKNYNWKKEEI